VTAAHLRRISYKYLFPIADNRGKSSAKRSGDLSDLFRDANSYLFSGNPVPPLRMINEFLAKGISDLGMGGGAEWEPFALTQAEYSSFLAYLDTPAGQRKFFRKAAVEIADPPDDVKTDEDYGIWKIRAAMEDPAHHFNTTRVFAIIDGEKVTMSLGESLLFNRNVVWHVDRSGGSD
jgi:hypothetical protein